MTTKRMKKLLMGMGLSRNQATRMIQEQRTEGSKDVWQRSLLSRLPKELQFDRVQLRRRGAALSQQLRFEVTTG